MHSFAAMNGTMLYARADESYAGSPRTSKFYVVAGYVAAAGEWFEFDRRWRRAMRQLGIEHLGCHAADCRGGRGEYAVYSPAQRGAIRRKLIEAVAESGIFGCVVASNLDGWRARRQNFSDLLGRNEAKFNEPHILVHRQCVHLMLWKTAQATDAPIAFMFDRNKDTGGRAKEWYNRDVTNKGLDAADMMGPLYRTRLGPYSDGDRLKVRGLQAADMLPYTAHRFFGGNSSWAWDELIAPKRLIVVEHFGEEYWREMEDRLISAKAIQGNGRDL